MYATDYSLLKRQLKSLLEGETHWLANLANTSALLFSELNDLNWVGFYLLEGTELVLGPFQGKPACVRIPLGKGVCGTAAEAGEVIVVPNVHEFPGHIVCDAASQSEIVVPMITGQGRLLGVLDVDSPVLQRFSNSDAEGLSELVEILINATHWPDES
ncbi:MAG: GAF domain-containing protein [Bacillota bacterium]|jgi:L-methionine (R)-S-oxide reductase|nr:GAF domain-containing protein [Bacillota bacterium]NLJ02220.1 GAF domain-containing protein [Bacillota bacterium]